MTHLDFNNKKVLIRVDFNVPFNKEKSISDDTRMRAALPTITKVLEEGGTVILMSHLGRPQKKLNEDGTINKEKFSLKQLVGHLTELLGVEVQFCEETIGEKAQAKVNALEKGQVLLLENTRFDKGESQGDEALAKGMADLADIYINDAFGTAHRAHASTTTVAQFFDKDHKGFGLLLSAELENAHRILNEPKRPLVSIVGGAKVSDKIMLLDKMLDFVDVLIVGGGMAYTFVKSQGGSIGTSICEDDKLDLAQQLLAKAKANGVQLLLPEDTMIADDFSNDANRAVTLTAEIPDEWMGLDIGPKTILKFSEVIKSAKTILWNGPMGVFEMENFATGTKSIAESVAAATQEGAFSLIGGGDSVAAIKQMGLSNQVSYVSTGGGAMLELLEGKELPGVKAMKA